MRAGDIITEFIRDVDSYGDPLGKAEVTPTKRLTTDKAVQIILGQEGTRLRLKIRREGVKKPFIVDVTRGRVEIETVFGVRRKENADWEFVIDRKNKIGYVRMSSFARNTYRDLEIAMRNLKRQGMKGLILDLRFNPGGLLESAFRVTNLFIDAGLIVTIRQRDEVSEGHYKCRNAGSLLDFPMVCLINGESASSSEIVSAALQDHDRARIFGERSRGKGSVQNIRDFEVIDPKTKKALKAEIKFTTATFWRPSGMPLDRFATDGDDWGVTPDKVIKLTNKERRDLAEHQRNTETIEPKGKTKAKPFQDRQLDAALKYLRGQVKKAGDR